MEKSLGRFDFLSIELLEIDDKNAQMYRLSIRTV
jgi:pimeloyl-CoA synthetase